METLKGPRRLHILERSSICTEVLVGARLECPPLCTAERDAFSRSPPRSNATEDPSTKAEETSDASGRSATLGNSAVRAHIGMGTCGGLSVASIGLSSDRCQISAKARKATCKLYRTKGAARSYAEAP